MSLAIYYGAPYFKVHNTIHIIWPISYAFRHRITFKSGHEGLQSDELSRITKEYIIPTIFHKLRSVYAPRIG